MAGLSFKVRKGETLALLGPNGSGKTTVIKLLAGLVIPTSGRITVNDVDVVRNRKTALKEVGVMLGDARSIYWRLSAYDNLEYFGVLRGVYGRQLKKRITTMANLLDFHKVLNRRAGELSRGMRQRLLLAIALLPKPKLLVLDEPTFGLDVPARLEIRGFLREIVSLNKCAVIIATHQMDEAQELANQICILRRGEPVIISSVADLFDKTNAIKGNKNPLSCWLEDMFLEVTGEETKGKAEKPYGKGGHPYC